MFIRISERHRVLSLCVIYLMILTLLVEGIVPPKTPVLSGFEPAAIGTYRELVCDASQPDAGTITYKWYKYSKDWPVSRGPIGRSQKYIFDQVSEKHQFFSSDKGDKPEPVIGKYLCRAINSAGTTRDSDWEDLYVYEQCPLYTVNVTPAKPAIGSTFTINCYIPNPSGSTTVTWTTQADSSSIVQDAAIANSKGCHAPTNTRYIWSSCIPPSLSSKTNTFNLQVTNAQTSDSAYWFCKDIGLSCRSDPVKIVLQAHPGTPQITGFPSGQAAEEAQVNLKCVALPPGDSYNWYKDGTKISTSLTYDFIVKKDSVGVYKCVAKNTVGSATSVHKTLTVYYKSDSVVVSSGKTSCHVNETDMFTCTATGGNPPATLKIYIKRSGATPEEVTQGQDRVMAKEDNQAEYYCEAKAAGYPSLDMTSTRTTYNVTFPTTKVSFATGATAAVQVGQVKTFTCGTDESNPVTSIKWYLYNIGRSWQDVTSGITASERPGHYGGKISTSMWSVSATKPMNGGTVRCTSTYTLTGHGFTKHADTLMSVKFNPSKITMIQKPDKVIHEGNGIIVICETDSANPATDIQFHRKRSGGSNWVKLTSEITSKDRSAQYNGQIRKSTLTVAANRLDDGATFECKVTNNSYQWYKTTNVTVYYPPVVKLSSSPVEVKEGDNLTLTCEASGGKPGNYGYTWYFKGTEVGGKTSKEYKLNAIAYTRSGEYKCEAVNYSPGGVGQASTGIDIRYTAKWNPELSEAFTVAGKPKESAEFVLHVIANPLPLEVNWFLPNKIAIGNSFTMFTATKINETTYTLKKTSISDKDYGSYTVDVKNDVGISSFVFVLQPAGLPFTPFGLRVRNATAISLTLAFKSNFSGGSPQTFNVQMKTTGGAWKDEVKVENDPGFGNDAIVKITDLKSNEEYQFQVQSTNQVGDSGYGVILTSRTKVIPYSTLSVNRDGETVTVSWQPLPERYTKVQIRYCSKRDRACALIEVKDQNKSSVSFPVKEGESYTFTLEILDGEDRIVASPVVSADPNGPSVAVIAGGVGGFLFVLIIIAVILAMVFILKKRQADKGVGLMTTKKKSNGNSGQVNQGFNDIGNGTNKNGESVELMSPSSSIQMESKGGGVFAKGNKTSKTPAMPTGDEYAQVDYSKKAAKNDAKPSEQGDVYAEVNKPKKPIKPAKPATDDQAVYANVQNEEDIYEDVHDDSAASGYKQPKQAYQVGVDGTLYAEVNIQPPRNPTVIKGSEEIEASYGSVDFSRQAPALKNADDPNDANFTELI